MCCCPAALDSRIGVGLRKAFESPEICERSKPGSLMPPWGPAMLLRRSGLNMPISDVDAAWCSIVTRSPAGVGGGSNEREGSAFVLKFDDVCRLRLLGFFLGFGSGGLTKAAGDAGADTCTSGSSEPSFNARPFAFRGFRGEGEVMGRSKESRIIGLSDMVRSSREWIPKPFDEKEDRGSMMTGDSGDELGDGSVRADESAVEIVVVGDESVDSEACVDVLSRCLCCSSGSGAGLAVALLSSSLGDCGDAAASPMAATSDCCGESTKALWSMLGALQL